MVSSSKGQLLEDVFIGKEHATIGSGQENDVVIEGWKVAKSHAGFQLKEDGVYVSNLAKMKPLIVNGRKLESFGPLTFNDAIEIADYVIQVKISTLAPGEQVKDAQIVSYEAQRKLYHQWQRKLHNAVADELKTRAVDLSSEASSTILKNVIADMMGQLTGIPESVDPTKVARRVYGEIAGYGPIDVLLENDAVSEIMVNNHDEIFYQENGINRVFNGSFTDDEAVISVIKRMVAQAGRHIDEKSPLVDATLGSRARINAVIPPLALRGPSLTIRKLGGEKLTASHLINQGSMSPQMLQFLKVAIANRKNMVISGGTGTGKSTLLNVLADFIPESERVVTIEDVAELSLSQPNRVELESRPPDAYGNDEIKIRDLVKNALRMSPDRIIVGECRGGEALDMLQAMNTGHDGSLTTVHANSPRDCVSRLEVLVLMSGVELPVSAIRNQIASSVDLIVQLTRFPCGSRKVTSISEVCGMEGGTVQLGELFSFQQDGYDQDGLVSGHFHTTGIIPSFYEGLRSRGVKLDMDIFAG